MSQSPLTATLVRVGEQVPSVKKYRISLSYTVPADAFAFTLYTTRKDTSNWGAFALELENVDFALYGKFQMAGRVEMSEVGSDGGAVQYQGRDYIADLIESHVDPSLIVPDNITLKAALQLVCAPVGITEVLGDDEVLLRNARTGVGAGKPAPADFLDAKAEQLKPQPGEGIYAFASKMAARFGASIQPGTKRTQIVVAAPRYDESPLYTLRRLRGGSQNNVLAATAKRDYTHFPTAVIVTGRQADGGGTGGEGVTATRAEQVEKMDLSLLPSRFAAEYLLATGRRKPKDGPFGDGKLYRLFYRRETSARNQAQVDKVAARAKAERTKAVLSYEATVRGHLDPESGAIWSPDTLVKVLDEVAYVEDTLWIESVEHTGDEQGAKTKITCLKPGSYVY